VYDFAETGSHIWCASTKLPSCIFEIAFYGTMLSQKNHFFLRIVSKKILISAIYPSGFDVPVDTI
jgi:hypothetical protein